MNGSKNSAVNSTFKHIHIVSDVGLLTSALGYILQQSESIDSRWFKRNNNSLKDPTSHNDPWDSRTYIFEKENSTKKKYVDISENRQAKYRTVDIDEFVDGLKVRTVFGMNHGGWVKHVEWRNPKVQCVFIDITKNTQKYFLNMISGRIIDDVEESILHHTVDHWDSDPEHLKKITETVYSRLHLQKEPVRFWQLQYTFWIDNNFFPLPEEKKDTFDKFYVPMITKNNTKDHNYVVYTNPMIVDIENLNLKKVCKDLNLVYNDRMEKEYQKFKEFFDFYVQM